MAGKNKKKTCFVIGPIGEPDSTIRKWANTISKYIIAPALEESGYAKPVRADQIPRPSIITYEVIQYLLTADLVIADLTGPNANAYYELAVRHAARKPFIQLIREDQEIPFDLQGLRTIRIGTEVEAAERAKAEIKRYIPEVEQASDKISNPISQVAELELLRASGDQQQMTLIDLLIKVDSIHALLTEMDKKLQSSQVQSPRRMIEEMVHARQRGHISEEAPAASELMKLIRSMKPPPQK
ncbi:MAG: hypothetical protein ACYTEQ_22410 [Planctomycetota bacterium]|jgi:hypothetical protein